MFVCVAAVVNLLTVNNLFLTLVHDFPLIFMWIDELLKLIDALQINYIHEPYTHLVPDLKGVDPDDAFSSVPYEKGSNLLMYLEQKLGGAGQ